MSPRPCLILFGKCPRYGAGKTRLARRIGSLQALRFQQAQLARLLRTLGSDQRWQTIATLTPSPKGLRAFPMIPVLPQSRGDLGRRMIRALQTAPGSGPVVLIGTDIPGITAPHIAAALQALSSTDLVFGPAEDGGYWLIGWSRRRPLPLAILQGVRWSTPYALSDSLNTLRHRRHSLTARLADLDE